MALLAYGIPLQAIAEIMGVSIPTLAAHCRPEI